MADEARDAKRNIPALREIIEERKEKAVETLSESYAKNRLPLEEYERLVEYINKIESERELVVVEKIVAEYDTSGTKAAPPAEDDDEEDATAYYSNHGHRTVSTGNLTVLSSRVFDGPVKSGSQYLSVLGTTHIKVRKADLRKKRTVLHIYTLLGDSVISVEPGIRVTNKALPLLGSADVHGRVTKRSDSGENELVIKGAALLGSINVKVLKE